MVSSLWVRVFKQPCRMPHEAVGQPPPRLALMRHPDTADHLGLTDIQRRHSGHDLLNLRIFLQHNTLPWTDRPGRPHKGQPSTSSGACGTGSCRRRGVRWVESGTSWTLDVLALRILTSPVFLMGRRPGTSTGQLGRWRGRMLPGTPCGRTVHGMPRESQCAKSQAAAKQSRPLVCVFDVVGSTLATVRGCDRHGGTFIVSSPELTCLKQMLFTLSDYLLADSTQYRPHCGPSVVLCPVWV